MRYYLFAILVSLGACTSPVKETREAKIINELTGNELVFTENLYANISKNDQLSLDVFQLKLRKIVTIVNYDFGLCRESIKKWKEFLKGKNITFLLIVKGGDEEFNNHIRSNESSSFKYIYHDSDIMFELTNKILPGTRLRTFLINCENKIHIISNPLFNKAIAKLYHKEIKNDNTPNTR